ncbi:MAG: hypothetical protein GY832_31600 [Chloroflexi bacterium]|nr:hypothetical protein [Chloroflexota bacterium]
MTKYCPDCGATKSVKEFGKDRTRGDGRYPYCKICRNKRDKVKGKKYRKTEKGRRVNREACLRYKYGITLDDYDRMFEAQNGVCAVCGKPQQSHNGRRLDVDHSHKTGGVRGLLCNKCNTVIGLVYEDRDILLKASEYLRKHQGE